MATRKTTPIIDRFYAQIERIPVDNACWIWTGSLSRGYGHVYIGKRNNKDYSKRAHRFSWELHKGQIPKELEVCHKCDVRCCVNPDHLFLGTRKDNMQDCSKKGRFNNDRHTSKTHCKRGHEFTKENTRICKSGSRHCRACDRLRVKNNYDAEKLRRMASELRAKGE